MRAEYPNQLDYSGVCVLIAAACQDELFLSPLSLHASGKNKKDSGSRGKVLVLGCLVLGCLGACVFGCLVLGAWAFGAWVLGFLVLCASFLGGSKQ